MNTNDLLKAVMELDLEPIKMKLMHVASGEGWSLEKANAVEKEYRRFLCLTKMYPEEDTAPLVDVDTFWHYHILDTMKYAADCEQAFGYFVHHSPSLEPQAAHESFCSLAAKKSFCSLAVEKAFCSLGAKNDAAFCSLAAKPAFCSLAAKPAFCSLAAKRAFCSLAIAA